MHVLGRKKGALIIAAAVMLMSATSPALLEAKPAPGYVPSGFRLFARSSFLWVGNRVQCFLSAVGQICSPSSSTIGGANWPAGTQNQYIFNTGLQVAGRVDPTSAGNPWAGDIDGVFFFNARGGGNGQQITNIFDSADQGDLDNWPTAAYVPSPPDPGADLYDPALHGLKTASDNDIWFLSWEGDPNLSAGRNHPLGLLVETRGLAYNTPGKNDFLFFIYTFYNITSGNAADYAGAPARIRDTLISVGARFQQLQAAKGDILPAGGYTLQDMFLAFAADMDVAPVGSNVDNYAGVNVPFALGYTYHHSFTAPSSWTFDPTIYRSPFFKGSGFIGVKYLKSPEVGGSEVGLTLFGATTNGGEFSDPPNTAALYRYLTGNLDPTEGDDFCNVGDVTVTRICYINQGAADDMRFFQASGPLTLAPGESSSIAVAYIFAPPVASGACTGPDVCVQLAPQFPTGSLTRLTDPAILPLGANTVDTISGFNGWRDTIFTRKGQTVFANGIVDQEEFRVIPGSLLGKSLTAQAVFDAKFVQPAPPKAPQFFLIPGDNQVTVVWQPSSTESEGDPYASAAQQAANFDPNYRAQDVAGYRVYRGIRGAESSLQLLAQFDVAGDSIVDYTGQMNTTDAQGFTDCAPELGVFISCTSAGTVNGVATIVPNTVFLDQTLVQYTNLVSTTQNGPTQGFVTRADTALIGGGSPLSDGGGAPLDLRGTGVPFVFVDKTGNCTRCGVRNHTQYFYMVTAFDVNSIRSGPSSLESNRSGSKLVVPVPSASNITVSGTLNPFTVVGRGATLPSGVPDLDETTGRFSGPFPPANAASISLAAFLPQMIAGPGTVNVTLDSLTLGSAWDVVPVTYYWRAVSGTSSVTFTTQVTQDATFAEHSASALYDALPLDPVLAARYGGGAGYGLKGSLAHTLVGTYYTNAYGRGCVNGADGFVPAADQAGCDYNGPRWFDGPSPANNETKADPIAGNAQNFTSPFTVDRTQPNNAGYNNAGELTGVDVIHQAYSYQTMGNQFREPEGVLAGAKRAADYNVYWNATTAGLIDSVVDITHDVQVPFDANKLAGSYGLLTEGLAQPSGVGVSFDQRTELSITDFGCVEPMRSFASSESRIACGPNATPGNGPVYTLTQQATLGNIVHFTGSPADVRTSPDVGTGFAMYLAGNMFMFQTTTLPVNTVWSMRDYVGGITGGNGYGGNDGPYRFFEVPRPFSAVGASLQVSFNASTTIAPATKRSLGAVHTVPDPYYVTNSFEQSADNKVIKFVNLPNRAIIRIYSVSGVLVRTLEHNSLTSSELTWDVRNRNNQFVASGVYFYHIEAIDARRIGRMTIVNFAK